MIHLSETAGSDGARFLSSRQAVRNIVLTLMLESEADKYAVFDLFQTQSTGTLYCRTSQRDVKISCYVESVEVIIHAMPYRAQVSLLCPQPYFENLEELKTYISQIIPLWEFDWELNETEGFEFDAVSPSLIKEVANRGEAPTGGVFVIYAAGNVKNPRITNINTHEFIQAGYGDGPRKLDMRAGDILRIDTRKGQKSIWLFRNGKEINAMNWKAPGSTFLQLAQGKNEFRYSADQNERNMEITLYYTEKYGGV